MEHIYSQNQEESDTHQPIKVREVGKQVDTLSFWDNLNNNKHIKIEKVLDISREGKTGFNVTGSRYSFQARWGWSVGSVLGEK